MKKAFSFLVLVFLCGTFSARLSAELSMPHIFADHMVLQRNEAINLWGSASPKEKVTVELNGQKTSVRAMHRVNGTQLYVLWRPVALIR